MADMVTFGVAPGFILFHLMGGDISTTYSFEIILTNLKTGAFNEQMNLFIPFIALLTPLLSAYRLANFNIDQNQNINFIGLPTPALAIFIAAIPLIDSQQFNIFSDLNNLIAIAIIMPMLLTSKLHLFSLKINNKEKITYWKINTIEL